MPTKKTTGKKLADMMYGNPEGAAFGVYPMIGKRREDRQDREAAKSFPVDLARGVVAGAVGMPGDIESLARLPYELITGNESPTFLPTSEDVLKRIPFGTDTPAGRFASGLGSIAGGSAPIGPVIRGAKALPGALSQAQKKAVQAGMKLERGMEPVVRRTMERGGLGADILRDMAQGSRMHIFIGPKAKTFHQGRADMAVAMEESGRTPQEIWLATGTFRGADGILRQEIDDRAAKLILPDEQKDRVDALKGRVGEMKESIKPTPQKDLFPKALTEAKKGVRGNIDALKEEISGRSKNARTQGIDAQYAFEHPELYEAYPELKGLSINMGGREGTASGARGALTVSPKSEGSPGYMEMDMYNRGLMSKNPTSTALHEMQHAVQTLEGMGPGGSPTFAFQNPEAHDILKRLREEAYKPASFEDFQRVNKFPEDEAQAAYEQYVKERKANPITSDKVERALQETAAMEYYKRLLGEAEARAVQDRQMMTPAQRMETPPPASYDVPQEDLIVKPPREYADGGPVQFSDNPDVMQLELAGGGLVKGIKAAAKAVKEAPKPDVQTPSVIIPGTVSNVKEALRKSEGAYGVRRIERAADEIKNLERLYNEKALREAFLGDNAKAVVTMNPADFERYAQILQGRTKADIGPEMQKLANQGDIDKYTVPTDEYIQHLMRVQGGFDQVPYLNLYKDEVGIPSMPEVRGHEGRHRSRALSEAGESTGLVQISPRGDLREGLPRRSQEEYIEALREELERSGRLVIPEVDGSLRRPAIELPEPYADGGAVRMQAGGVPKFIEAGAKALKALKPAKVEKEAAVPLTLPRVRPTTKDIMEAAERVGKQQAGEFVKNPLTTKTSNLAGRSKKEVERLKNLEYKVTPIKDLPEVKPYEAKIGEVNIALPGDQTISDMLLESVDDIPIGTTSEGGALFGRGRLSDPEETRAFWASNIGPAELFQKKVTELAQLYDTDMVTAYHLAMGQMSNNFAQHLADANIRAIDYSKLNKDKMNAFDRVVSRGYVDPTTKERVTFENWPGIADPEGSLQAMKEDPKLRKWFNNRMKTEKVTKPLDLPNAKSIEWAMTEPELRNMEINLTGLSAGRMKPGAELISDSAHQTYSHDIPGTALGRAPELSPFSISFPDATAFVREKYRPQDFTGTIQKVFPHQVVDEAYLEDMYKYYTQLRKVRGFNEGGAVRKAAGGEITADDLILEERKL